MKLSPIYVCDKCGERYQLDNHVNGEHSYFGVPCNGTLIPHYSLPDLELYLEGWKQTVNKPDFQNNGVEPQKFLTLILDYILKDLKEAV